MRECFGHQHAGDRGALGGHAAELLRDAHDVDAEFGGNTTLEHCGRGRTFVVGVRGGRADLLGRELDRDVADHLLVLGGVQVEHPPRRRRASAAVAEPEDFLAANLRPFTAPAVPNPDLVVEDAVLQGLAKVESIKGLGTGC